MSCSAKAAETCQQLRRAVPAVLPSLLLCDFGNLEREIRLLEAAGVPALHLDVMDGHFVPNLTYGPTIVRAVRSLTQLPLDVHLMITRPADWIDQYVAAGADIVTIHAEAVDDPRPVLAAIRDAGAAAGLAINPGTPVGDVEGLLTSCDLILTMSVEPGFGGQPFNEIALRKLRALRDREDCQALLEVDGGVNTQTAARCAAAGAELFVAGSAIFGTSDYRVAVGTLQEMAQTAMPA